MNPTDRLAVTLMEKTGAIESAKMMFDYILTAMEAPEMIDIVSSTNAWEALMEGTLTIYEKNFTREEMQELITFYDSDIGKTLISKMPAVMTECMAFGELWGRTLENKIDNLKPDPNTVLATCS